MLRNVMENVRKCDIILSVTVLVAGLRTKLSVNGEPERRNNARRRCRSTSALRR